MAGTHRNLRQKRQRASTQRIGRRSGIEGPHARLVWPAGEIYQGTLTSAMQCPGRAWEGSGSLLNRCAAVMPGVHPSSCGRAAARFKASRRRLEGWLADVRWQTRGVRSSQHGRADTGGRRLWGCPLLRRGRLPGSRWCLRWPLSSLLRRDHRIYCMEHVVMCDFQKIAEIEVVMEDEIDARVVCRSRRNMKL